MTLDWRYHALIQALLSRGPLKEEDFHAVFAGVSGKHPATHQELFNKVLFKINKELAYVQFELRACRNQYDGQVYYGVVNKVADEESKLGTKYSVPQIAFYKAVIAAIAQDTTTQGCITSMEALYIRPENQSSQENQTCIPHAFKSFTASQKEKTLNDLIKDKWLCYTSNGRVGLGVRSFLDLRSWFRSNDVPSCEVCNEAGVQAAVCPSEGCSIRMHYYCLKKKFPQLKGSRACPGCGTEWPRTQYEEEEDRNAPEQNEVPSANRVTGKRLKRVKAEAVEAAQAQAETENEAHSSSALRKKSLRSCKAEAIEAAQTETECETEAPRNKKRLRSRKAEAVEAAQAQTESEVVASRVSTLRKRLRSCKAEAVEVAKGGSSQETRSYGLRRRDRQRNGV